MDKLQQMRVFVGVVDAGGLASAARALGVSAPAVTRALNGLERQLGARLLTRTTRVVRVTEAGARYADDCRRVLQAVAEADALARGDEGAPHGCLRLTAPGWFGAEVVAPIVADFLSAHPGVSAECLFLDRVVNLVEEGVDIAIRIANLPDSSTQAIRVGEMRLVTCAAPSYLTRRGTPRAIADLARHDVVLASAVTPGSVLRLKDRGRVRSVRVASRFASTTNEAAVAAAMAGFGLTQQMFYKVAAPLADGRLREVLGRFEPPPLPVHVLHREGPFPARHVRAFLDMAIPQLRALRSLRGRHA